MHPGKTSIYLENIVIIIHPSYVAVFGITNKNINFEIKIVRCENFKHDSNNVIVLSDTVQNKCSRILISIEDLNVLLTFVTDACCESRV